jgi:serine/threonine protein kinase
MGTDFNLGEFIEERWEILRVLRGGMGVVYIVRDETTDETLAAKTYRDDVFRASATVAERFEQEALTWIRMGAHPNVVQARFVRRVERKPIVFLEFARGGSLRALLPFLALSASRPGDDEYYGRAESIKRLAVQFCDGMIHANRSGVLAHRDIKPENCLLCPSPRPPVTWSSVPADAEAMWINEQRHRLRELTPSSLRDWGVLKITDFGLAKTFEGAALADSDSARAGQLAAEGGLLGETVWVPPRVPGLEMLLTRTGVAAGTKTHMAPEQFEDLKRVDNRGDIYSFGVMLYQMVTGELPFVGHDFLDYMRLHQTAPPPNLTTAFPKLNALISQCLAKSPSDRFRNFVEVRAALITAIFDRHETYYPCVLAPPAAAKKLTRAELLDKAASLLELGRPLQALAALDEHLTRNPDDSEAHARKGILLMNACHRFGEALMSLERAQQLGQQGLEMRIAFCRHKLS